MFHFARSAVKRMLNRYPQWVAKDEFTHQKFTRFSERPVELEFVFRQLARLYPRTVLDVGTGRTALPHLMRSCGCMVTAIDNIRDYWSAGMINRHYHVIDDDISATHLSGPYELITCISVLEHIKKYDDAVRNMFSLLAPGGHIVLSFPYNERTYHPNVYDLPGSTRGKGMPYVTQAYSRVEVNRWLKQSNGVIVEQEYWQFFEGDQWTVGNEILPPRKVEAGDRHQLTCLLLTKASGAGV